MPWYARYALTNATAVQVQLLPSAFPVLRLPSEPSRLTNHVPAMSDTTMMEPVPFASHVSAHACHAQHTLYVRLAFPLSFERWFPMIANASLAILIIWLTQFASFAIIRVTPVLGDWKMIASVANQIAHTKWELQAVPAQTAFTNLLKSATHVTLHAKPALVFQPIALHATLPSDISKTTNAFVKTATFKTVGFVNLATKIVLLAL
jgi:hypothetical protein